MNNAKIVCPKCGSVIKMVESAMNCPDVTKKNGDKTTATCANATKTPVNKAQARIDALKASGVDTSNLFAVNSASGEIAVGRLENGTISLLDNSDPIFAAIKNSGVIPERRLFRRWVMSQMFHMLASPQGFNAALKEKGYEYSWKMLEEELRVQAKLAINDNENYIERERWFNSNVVVKMMRDYVKKLRIYIDSLPVRHCKGVPYKHIHGQNIFVEDLEKKIYMPLTLISYGISLPSEEPLVLLKKVQDFNRKRYRLPNETYTGKPIKMSSDFVSAFKGAGAYFTLKNLILFHGCSVYDPNGQKYNQKESLHILEYTSEINREHGYKVFAFMKDMLDKNNIDIEKKISEW